MNVPIKDDLYPRSSSVSISKGNTETAFSKALRSRVPLCSPTITNKLVTYVNIREEYINDSAIYNIREKRGNKGNKGNTDPRLNSEKFCQDVRLVLEYLSVENTVGNFKKYGSDFLINWEEFAHNIRHPKQTAIVEILFRGDPTGKTICVDLPGSSKTEAIKKLNTKQYIFLEWW